MDRIEFTTNYLKHKAHESRMAELQEIRNYILELQPYESFTKEDFILDFIMDGTLSIKIDEQHVKLEGIYCVDWIKKHLNVIIEDDKMITISGWQYN